MLRDIGEAGVENWTLRVRGMEEGSRLVLEGDGGGALPVEGGGGEGAAMLERPLRGGRPRTIGVHGAIESVDGFRLLTQKWKRSGIKWGDPSGRHPHCYPLFKYFQSLPLFFRFHCLLCSENALLASSSGG